MIALDVLKGIILLALFIVRFLIKKYFEMLIDYPFITIIMTIICIIFW